MPAMSDAEPTVAKDSRPRQWSAPGWLFHGLVVVVGLLLLWSLGTPGWDVPLLLLSLLMLAGFGLVWLVRSTSRWSQRGRPQ